MATSASSSASPTVDETPANSGAKPDHADAHVDELPLSPLQADQRAAKQEALESVATGNATVEQGGVQLSNGKWVQWGAPETEQIWTLLVEFGDDDCDYEGERGPLMNEIPEPDRDWNGDSTDDNTTAWTEDFNRDHYQEMLFGEDGGMSMTDFYLKQSGGRYTVTGEVEDWVKVDCKVARYGAAPEADGYGTFVRHSAQAWYDSKIDAGWSEDEIADYLAEYDVWDRYDFDADGDFDEPDGYVDHIQIIHAGEGEEAGGGAYGADQIWSHRWYAQGDLAGPDHNPAGGAPVGDSGMWVGDYTTEPENGGLGVFAHEYGHDLGLPDLYDTSGGGTNGTGRWTLMSGGSWMNTGGDNIGDMPNYMGPWEKYFLGWLDYDTVALDDDKSTNALGGAGASWPFKAAVKVDLPDIEETREYQTPYSGEWQWMGGEGDDINASLTRTLDLSGAADSAEIAAQVRLDTEADYDFFFAEVSVDGGPWTRVGDEHDGDNGDYESIAFDLSEYVGEEIGFRYRYVTDTNTHGTGVFIDDVELIADGESVWLDDVESDDGAWDALGWKRSTGVEELVHAQFYLAENRRYVGYDDSLRTGPYNFGWGAERPNWVERYPYQEGMVVWYVNTSYTDNNTSQHPGGGLALPVDARPDPLSFNGGTTLSPTHQVYDAAFGNKPSRKLTLHRDGEPTTFDSQSAVPVFDDSDPDAYWSEDLPGSSVKVAGEGVKIKVVFDGGKFSPMIVKITRS
ncbi:MAG: immune inhibitor A domain-containing protein [Stackebrandtia sp.]